MSCRTASALLLYRAGHKIEWFIARFGDLQSATSMYGDETNKTNVQLARKQRALCEEQVSGHMESTMCHTVRRELD